MLRTKRNMREQLRVRCRNRVEARQVDKVLLHPQRIESEAVIQVFPKKNRVGLLLTINHDRNAEKPIFYRQV